MSWMSRAACKGMPVELFMPRRGEVVKIREARKVCFACPVLSECREYSMRAAQEADLDGIFGGWTKIERQRHMRRQGLRVRRMGYSNAPMPEPTRRMDGDHGTASAYRRHIRDNESPCDECYEAHQARLYRRAQYDRTRR